MVDWLQKTPKVTSIRVNLLRISSERLKSQIERMLLDLKYMSVFPKIDIFQPIYEILLIQNIDEKFMNCRQVEEYKEIIVDVSCGAAVLRGEILVLV